MTSHRILGLELMLIFGGVWVGYLEEINVILRTVSLLMAIPVAFLTGYKLLKEFRAKKNE